MSVSTSSCHAFSPSAWWSLSNCPGVMIARIFFATTGPETPRHGCRNTTSSLSAVVKIAPRTVRQYSSEDGLTPSLISLVTNYRTSTLPISIIRIGPNHGMMCRSR